MNGRVVLEVYWYINGVNIYIKTSTILEMYVNEKKRN